MRSQCTLAFLLPLSVICTLGLLQLPASADCISSAEETTGLVLEYLGGEDLWNWCPAMEDVLLALEYWGIREDEGEVYCDVQVDTTDSPRLTIALLEEQVPGKRVVYISTHGSSDSFGALVAAEWYDTYSAMWSAFACYTDPGRTDPYVPDTEITWVQDILLAMPHRPEENDTNYVILLTDVGIENHLNSDDPGMRLADEAIIYANWCMSTGTQGKWGEDTFVGHDDSTSFVTSCSAATTFWQRLRCEDYPRRKGNTEDAAQGTALSVDGTILDNRLDCTRSCKDMNPAARLGSQWAYMESGGVVIGWHVEAELDNREYRVEAGDGLTWELIASVARGDMAAPLVYSVRVESGYRYYRVTEIDRDDQRCEFHPLVPAEAPPGFLPDLMETAKGFEAMALKRQPPDAPCIEGESPILEKAQEDMPDWVFYGPDSLLAECAPAVSWFESEGLVVDTVLAVSPDH